MTGFFFSKYLAEKTLVFRCKNKEPESVAILCGHLRPSRPIALRQAQDDNLFVAGSSFDKLRTTTCLSR